MDFSDTFPGVLLGFLFTLAQLGFLPGAAAYFVAKSRLERGKNRLRSWKPALTGVLVLMIGIYLDDGWDGTGIGIMSFIVSGALFGIAAGFALAWLDSKPNNLFKKNTFK